MKSEVDGELGKCADYKIVAIYLQKKTPPNLAEFLLLFPHQWCSYVNLSTPF